MAAAGRGGATSASLGDAIAVAAWPARGAVITDHLVQAARQETLEPPPPDVGTTRLKAGGVERLAGTAGSVITWEP